MNEIWTPVNANVKIGSTVKVHLSDAPEFTGIVTEIREDENFNASFKIITNRGAMWISEYRIVAVKVS